MSLMNKVSGWMKARKLSPTKAARPRRSSPLAAEQLESREMLAGDPVIGINLERVVDWSPAWTFTDVFKSSREWVSHSYNTVTGQFTWGDAANNGGTVNVDSKGWPTRLNEWTNAQGQLMQQQLGTLMLDGQNGHYPGGVYRAEWEGTGSLTWGHDARVTQTGLTENGRHFALLSVTPGNAGIYMRINSMSNSDPIRNVHVWMPDYNGQRFAGQEWTPGSSFSPFHPLFVERLRPFDTIRFMHWGVGSTSDIAHWSDRPKVDDARQSTPWEASYFQDGVAPEYMIALANELDADPWLTMPHMADDDFVRHYAELVRDTLEPGQKVYVEWGNEIWNGAPGFDGNRWVQSQMQLPENAGLSFYQIWAREARRDFDIWSQVFAGQANRLVRVAAGFQNTPWVTNQVLSNMGGAFDAVSCAMYTGLHSTQTSLLTASTTGEQIIDILLNESIPRDLNFLRSHQTLANQYSASLGRDIQLLAYEGGPHLDGRGAVYQQAFYDAGVSPRMYDVYDRILTGARDIGLDLFMQFNYTGRPVPSPQGDFAILHWQDQPVAESPKYRALLDAISGTLYEGTPVLPTVTIAATDASAAEAGRDPAVFTVTRTGATTQALTVGYTVSGTATSGNDYTALSGSVTIPLGALSATVTLTPIDDALVEPSESIVLTLSANAAYSLGAPTSAMAAISDNDVVRPTVTIAAIDGSASEANRDPASFRVTRSGAMTQALTVTYRASGTAANGSDYALLSGSVTIPLGASTATIIVTPIEDAAAEGRETIVLTLQPGASYIVGAAAMAMANLADNDAAALPVLMVIANTDFYYQEYSDTRRELEAAGLRVVVAAGTRTLARPHFSSGQGASAGTVMPDLAITDVRAADYSTVVFVGGWGASMYQYGFTGTYANVAYNGSLAIEQAVNRLITEMVQQDKYITGICHGVTVLAWARVNGASPLAGRRVSAYAGGAPPSNIAGSLSTRWHVEQNGATMVASRSIGNVTTAADDVLVDGKLITAENWDSAAHFGRTIVDYLRN